MMLYRDLTDLIYTFLPKFHDKDTKQAIIYQIADRTMDERGFTHRAEYLEILLENVQFPIRLSYETIIKHHILMDDIFKRHPLMEIFDD